MVTEAIILAGGLGTRLQPVVSDVPKCLAPVNGIPFLTYVIDAIQKQGITRFIFSVGYKSDSIIDFVDSNYKHLDKVFVFEKEPLGTGGAIKEACKNLYEKNVLVFNADTFFPVDLQELADIHTKQKAECTIALKRMTNFSRYGAVETSTTAIVTAFKEKQFTDKGLINGGIYVLNVKRFLKNKLPAVFSFEKEYLEKNTSNPKLLGIAFDNYFIDIGVPEDYERAQKELSFK